jgi:hypothetical protein
MKLAHTATMFMNPSKLCYWLWCAARCHTIQHTPPRYVLDNAWARYTAAESTRRQLDVQKLAFFTEYVQRNRSNASHLGKDGRVHTQLLGGPEEARPDPAQLTCQAVYFLLEAISRGAAEVPKYIYFFALHSAMMAGEFETQALGKGLGIYSPSDRNSENCNQTSSRFRDVAAYNYIPFQRSVEADSGSEWQSSPTNSELHIKLNRDLGPWQVFVRIVHSL